MASFDKFIPSLTAAEGGYQHDPKDRGNYNSLGENVGTNHGISARFYEQVTGTIPTVTVMKNITKATALQLFKFYYWDALQAPRINSQAVAELFIDHAINATDGSSPNNAVKMLQKTLKHDLKMNVDIDGYIGNETLTAVNNADAYKVFQFLAKRREMYYRGLSTFWHFGHGWLKRISDLAAKFKIELLTPGSSIYNGAVIVGFFTILAGFGYLSYLKHKIN